MYRQIEQHPRVQNVMNTHVKPIANIAMANIKSLHKDIRAHRQTSRTLSQQRQKTASQSRELEADSGNNSMKNRFSNQATQTERMIQELIGEKLGHTKSSAQRSAEEERAHVEHLEVHSDADSRHQHKQSSTSSSSRVSERQELEHKQHSRNHLSTGGVPIAMKQMPPITSNHFEHVKGTRHDQELDDGDDQDEDEDDEDEDEEDQDEDEEDQDEDDEDQDDDDDDDESQFDDDDDHENDLPNHHQAHNKRTFYWLYISSISHILIKIFYKLADCVTSGGYMASGGVARGRKQCQSSDPFHANFLQRKHANSWFWAASQNRPLNSENAKFATAHTTQTNLCASGRAKRYWRARSRAISANGI